MTLTDYQIHELKYGISHGIRGANYAQPFYWTAMRTVQSAPSGWYQWTPQGLVYLGESILEGA
jgi:hypothetical protein